MIITDIQVDIDDSNLRTYWLWSRDTAVRNQHGLFTNVHTAGSTNIRLLEIVYVL